MASGSTGLPPPQACSTASSAASDMSLSSQAREWLWCVTGGHEWVWQLEVASSMYDSRDLTPSLLSSIHFVDQYVTDQTHSFNYPVVV